MSEVKTQRPLSPHITIYKPQITSVLSITHRVTGVFLVLGAFLFVWELVAIASGGDAFALYVLFATSSVGYLVAAMWILSFVYHLFNGIRHLFWDAGCGYEIPTVTVSGWLVIVMTALVSAVIFTKVFGV